jgi:hypothetical protein
MNLAQVMTDHSKPCIVVSYARSVCSWCLYYLSSSVTEKLASLRSVARLEGTGAGPDQWEP